MQLKKSRAIRKKLALASSALLLASPLAANENNATIDDPASNDSIGISQLFYAEENRVNVEKTQAIISKEITESDKIKLSYVYDTMSGASPNGRIFSGDTGGITTTSPSGSTGSGSNANSAAWKTTFSDTREAFNGEWEHKFMSTFTGVFGGGVSTENDYSSNTFSGKFLLDINQRRTTLTSGMSVSLDTVSPIGGVPEGASALACYENALFRPNWDGLNCDQRATPYKPADKVVNDYLVGVTQVWNRRTLMQFNFAFSFEDGYLTDPYKQVSVISSQLDGAEVAVLYEKRPNTRNTRSIYYKVVHIPTDNTAIHLSYRYYWDDWGVSSDTINGRLRMNISPRVYIQTHARLHWQMAADFFQPFVTDDIKSKNYSANTPNYISADSRLGELLATTAGIKIGLQINSQTHLSVRIEKMTQRYKNQLLPKMKAIITQINLNFKF